MIRYACCLLFAVSLSAADVSGEWSLHMLSFGEEYNAARLILESKGSVVTGRLNELTIQGKLEIDHLQLTALRDGKEWGRFDGRLEGDALRGTVKQGSDEFTFTGRRLPAAALRPRIHQFDPTRFERRFSSEFKPVLQIRSGDTVKTKTVDAGGFDENKVRRSMGGNPETGPFYVEGAMPGDTLAIKILRLHLNRDSADSGDRIVPTRVDPDYFKDSKFADDYDSS